MDVTRQVVLEADVADVWRLLVDEEELSTWFGGPVRLDLRPGGSATFVEGDVVRHALVDRVEPGQALGFTWWTDDGPASTVVLELDPVEDGTRLTVTETVREAAVGEARASLYAGAAWAARLLGLEWRVLAVSPALLSARM